MAPQPLRLTFENYRSFASPVTLDLSTSLTFIIGQNNSGKTNILRAIAIVFNPQGSDILDSYVDFDDRADQTIRVIFYIRFEDPALSQLRERVPAYIRRLADKTADGWIPLPWSIARGNKDIDIPAFIESWRPIISKVDAREMSAKLSGGSSGDEEHNFRSIAGSIKQHFNTNLRTIYLPSIRYISKPGQSLPSFNEAKIAGDRLLPETIVDTLKRFDRPPAHLQAEKLKLRHIEEFVAYCLEKSPVTIEVAEDSSAIIAGIDGVSRPLSNLGTGLEQLVMVGTAALGFGSRIVLLEEPELHLHPTVQKRMARYLSEKINGRMLISTHSAAILDGAPASILFVKQTAGHSRTTYVRADQDRFEVVRDLGYRSSDLVQANFVIWVEGPSDRLYIKRWLSSFNEDLRENVDYSIFFYGGRLLSHLTFEDQMADDLISVLYLNRNAAVVMDSDKIGVESQINATKTRIRTECLKIGAICWITEGREIGNYIDPAVIGSARSKFPRLSKRRGKYQKLVGSKVSKVELAKYITRGSPLLDVYDLRLQITEIARAITKASESDSAVAKQPEAE